MTNRLNKKNIILFGILLLVVLAILNGAEIFYSIRYAFKPEPVFIKLLEGFVVGGLLYLLLFYRKILPVKSKESFCIDNLTLFLFSLLASYRLIYLYANNISQTSFFGAASIILIFILLFYIMFFISKTVFLDNYRALIIALVSVAATSFYLPNLLLLPLYVGFILFLCLLLLLLPNLKKIIAFLRPFALTLIILCLVNVSYKLLNIKLSGFLKSIQKIEDSNEFKIGKIPNRDVYIILLDMYTGQKTLDIMGFNNSDFTGRLREKGFVAYENINSNYDLTEISISSFLNADYVENLHFNTPSDATSSALMFKAAKQAGYGVYYLRSSVGVFRPYAGVIDELYNSSCNSNVWILELFFKNTPLAFILNSVRDDLIKEHQMALKLVDEIIDNNDFSKKFVFMHLVMPHWPYIYDEYGSLLFASQNSNSGYISYLKYTNLKVLEILDKIFTKKKEKPIVIILGDHGALRVFYTNSADKSKLALNFNTFLAYYNPDYLPKYYKNTKSHVNFFRSFLNENFTANLKSIEDKYIWVHPDTITSFHILRGDAVNFK